MSQASKQQIIYIHGRGPKPNQAALQQLWTEALAAGLQRDAPKKVEAFAAADVHMLYYAHHLDEFAESGFDETLDLDNRRQALQALKTNTKAKDFRRKHYESLPGKTPLKEFLMDVSASIGLGNAAIKKTMPELASYWQNQEGWAGELQRQLTDLLRDLMTQDKNILIISHCMGSVVAWDGLWQLTQSIRSGDEDLKRITRWVTLGSPLGARAVQSQLAGAGNAQNERFPGVLNAWHNISAEDDYVCHDKTVADDFKGMLNNRVIGDIRDHTIYNLAVRHGRSNPHSSLGYLIHPRTALLLAEWLD
jgi:hypothetical protein